MSLNIKNEETHKLAKELAELTGETMTGAIAVAIQQRIERERRERSVEIKLQRMRGGLLKPLPRLPNVEWRLRNYLKRCYTNSLYLCHK